MFQPAEETAEGARAMIEDGLLRRFPKPDVILGQHVMVGPAGTVAGTAGVITSAAESRSIQSQPASIVPVEGGTVRPSATLGAGHR